MENKSMNRKKEYDHSSSSPTSTPTCVIKVNINCCKSCQIKVKKGLLKLTGVDSVVVDPEKKLVYVTGKVDPLELVTKFAKWGKKSQLLSYDKESMNEQNHNKGEFKEAHIGKERKNYNCHSKKIHKDYFSHEPEKYMPPKELDINNICRDPFCKIHVRNKVIKIGPPLMPGRSGAGMMWHHRQQHSDPFPHGGLGGYSPHGLPHPGFGYSRIPPYEQYYPQMAPPVIGYRNLPTSLHGFDNFSDYFNDENKSCSII